MQAGFASFFKPNPDPKAFFAQLNSFIVQMADFQIACTDMNKIK